MHLRVEVQFVWAYYKGQQIGKVVQGIGRCAIYIEQVQQEKAYDTSVPVVIHPSKVVISRTKLDQNCKRALNIKPNVTQ